MSGDGPQLDGSDAVLSRLKQKFRDQEAFTTDYSPLYARLFGSVAGWLSDPNALDDALVQWLVAVGKERRSLEVTLLLAAGLHRDVLAGEAAAADLARYFPTAGGAKQPHMPEFEIALRETILARRQELAPFIEKATVQTNETGRGLCWLLPVMSTGWDRVYLVDLGASAGLNLVAEQRAYRLVSKTTEERIVDLGLAQPVQFVTRCEDNTGTLNKLASRQVPQVSGRIGCDLAPFRLETEDDELRLMSFVWGDQVNRLQRLREGIAAYRQVQQSSVPVRLRPVNLPDGLGGFLNDQVPLDDEVPVVIYNTWMTSYLRDKGQSMMFHIDHWAASQTRPILWLQWEPARDGREPPYDSWCAWTADLWDGTDHHYWQLGWAHPHGGDAVLGPAFNQLKSRLT